MADELKEETIDYETKLGYIQQIELLNSQLQVAEALNLAQKAIISGNETRITELEKMLKENPTAQDVIVRNLAKVSQEIDQLKQTGFVTPGGLSRMEEQAVLSLRQAMQKDLEQKHEELKKYIRGEL